MMSGRSSCRYPFTPSQWQELEHQALIFKYMASGIPIPSDLILPLRRSYLLDSTITSPTLGFPPQPSMSWGWNQVGFGRKADDPEPGRCRRTDGKKWRCAKEAYPDSKYCERHMHRGKNRSRKPVEMSLATTLPSSTTSSTSSTSHNPSPYPPPLSISTPDSYHLLYPYHSSSRPPGVGLSTPHFNLDAPTYTQPDKDYRYCHGMKDVDEYSFFSEASGSERESSWQFRPLGMSLLGESKKGSSALQQSAYAQCERDAEEKQQQHCFVLGADFKLERPVKAEREQEGQRPLRHFFDEWPQKSKDSWVDLEQENPNQAAAAAYSKTQLSISIPMSHHDFPVTSCRYRNDD
ncbi:growth-regulating factor 1-like [Phoenix dactylifera]|uniref:Growth-regulating factor n=1 Tax=Phoenix dactylifera TaxID=42345 RepID=A0A8B9AN38_PHODC|nr:growth-regulating factor 1-like [Phoenix dactylifera]